MKVVFNPGPAFWDERVRRYAGWLIVYDLMKAALEDLGFELYIPNIPAEMIDAQTTVSKITTWDLGAASQLPQDVDLFLGVPGYSLAQIMTLKARRNPPKVVTVVFNNADWWRDRQLQAEYQAYGRPYDMSPAWRWINTKALEISDLVIACSPFVKKTHATLVPEEKIAIVPWGVDSIKFAPDWEWQMKNPRPLRVLFAGSDPVRKGLAYLLIAMKGMEGAELTIVGTDAKVEIGGIKITSMGMIPNEEMPAAMRHHHVICIPTLEDGIAMVVQEGMASGLVPIATPDAAEVFNDPLFTSRSDVGFAVGFRDPPAIRRHLEWLRDHPAERLEMARDAREIAEKQKWETFKQGIAGTIQRLVGRDNNGTA